MSHTTSHVQPPTMTTAQAAQFLNRSVRTLRSWACGAGTPPEGISPVRVGRTLHWPVEQLERALKPKD